MAPSPTQVSQPPPGFAGSQGVATATKAPRASSQARVNGEK